MSAITEGDLPAHLLSYLRDALRTSSIEYTEQPRQITGGFDTSIYGFRLEAAPSEWSVPLILRVFQDVETSWRPADGAQLARFEAAVQKELVALSYPAPRVMLLCADREPLGRAFIIMERVRGHTMLEGFLGPQILRMPGLLARTHAALHELDPAGLTKAFLADDWISDWTSLDNELARRRRHVAQLQLGGLEPGIAWIVDHRPTSLAHPVICHGDFHPLNILTDGGRVTGVIDWSGARIADAAYDVGATIALFEHGPVDLPAFLRPLIGWARRRLIGRYLRVYRNERTIDPTTVRYYEALRCLGFLIEAGEQRRAEANGTLAQPGPFGAPQIARSLITRFRQITGVRLSLERD